MERLGRTQPGDITELPVEFTNLEERVDHVRRVIEGLAKHWKQVISSQTGTSYYGSSGVAGAGGDGVAGRISKAVAHASGTVAGALSSVTSGAAANAHDGYAKASANEDNEDGGGDNSNDASNNNNDEEQQSPRGRINSNTAPTPHGVNVWYQLSKLNFEASEAFDPNFNHQSNNSNPNVTSANATNTTSAPTGDPLANAFESLAIALTSCGEATNHLAHSLDTDFIVPLLAEVMQGQVVPVVRARKQVHASRLELDAVKSQLKSASKPDRIESLSNELRLAEGKFTIALEECLLLMRRLLSGPSVNSAINSSSSNINGNAASINSNANGNVDLTTNTNTTNSTSNNNNNNGNKLLILLRSLVDTLTNYHKTCYESFNGIII